MGLILVSSYLAFYFLRLTSKIGNINIAAFPKCNYLIPSQLPLKLIFLFCQFSSIIFTPHAGNLSAASFLTCAPSSNSVPFL